MPLVFQKQAVNLSEATFGEGIAICRKKLQAVILEKRFAQIFNTIIRQIVSSDIDLLQRRVFG